MMEAWIIALCVCDCVCIVVLIPLVACILGILMEWDHRMRETPADHRETRTMAGDGWTGGGGPDRAYSAPMVRRARTRLTGRRRESGHEH